MLDGAPKRPSDQAAVCTISRRGRPSITMWAKTCQRAGLPCRTLGRRSPPLRFGRHRTHDRGDDEQQDGRPEVAGACDGELEVGLGEVVVEGEHAGDDRRERRPQPKLVAAITTGRTKISVKLAGVTRDLRANPTATATPTRRQRCAVADNRGRLAKGLAPGVIEVTIRERLGADVEGEANRSLQPLLAYLRPDYAARA